MRKEKVFNDNDNPIPRALINDSFKTQCLMNLAGCSGGGRERSAVTSAGEKKRSAISRQGPRYGRPSTSTPTSLFLDITTTIMPVVWATLNRRVLARLGCATSGRPNRLLRNRQRDGSTLEYQHTHAAGGDEVEQDLDVWTFKAFLAQPALAKGDGPVAEECAEAHSQVLVFA